MLSSSKHGAGSFSSLLEEALIAPMCRTHDGHRIRAQDIRLHAQFTREAVRTRRISGVSVCCWRLPYGSSSFTTLRNIHLSQIQPVRSFEAGKGGSGDDDLSAGIFRPA